MASLPSNLESYVLSGREIDTIDLKRAYDLKKDGVKEDLAKDICAIANTSERTGYLIVGVNDAQHRKGNPAIPGLSIESEEVFDSQISHVVDNYIENPPRIEINFYEYQQKSICVISISCIDRPHLIRGTKVVYVRRGTHNREANTDEILDMARERIRLESLFDICDDLIHITEEFPFPEDVMIIIANLVAVRIRKIVDLISPHISHKYWHLLSKSYFILADYRKCLSSIDVAIDNKPDHRYMMMRAKVYHYYSQYYFDEATKDNLAFDIKFDANKEINLFDCIKNAEKSLEDLEAAREMGGDFWNT